MWWTYSISLTGNSEREFILTIVLFWDLWWWVCVEGTTSMQSIHSNASNCTAATNIFSILSEHDQNTTTYWKLKTVKNQNVCLLILWSDICDLWYWKIYHFSMLYLVAKPRYCIGTGVKIFWKIPRTQSIILKIKQSHKNSHLNTVHGTGKDGCWVPLDAL